jgi:hypothetical protein
MVLASEDMIETGQIYSEGLRTAGLEDATCLIHFETVHRLERRGDVHVVTLPRQNLCHKEAAYE